MRMSGFPEIPANFFTCRAKRGNLQENEQQRCQRPPGAGRQLQGFVDLAQ